MVTTYLEEGRIGTEQALEFTSPFTVVGVYGAVFGELSAKFGNMVSTMEAAAAMGRKITFNPETLRKVRDFRIIRFAWEAYCKDQEGGAGNEHLGMVPVVIDGEKRYEGLPMDFVVEGAREIVSTLEEENRVNPNGRTEGRLINATRQLAILEKHCVSRSTIFSWESDPEWEGKRVKVEALIMGKDPLRNLGSEDSNRAAVSRELDQRRILHFG